jgi:UDP-N-acetylglucosamine/UDP-N-acetylgalactosamine diphosphorylase
MPDVEALRRNRAEFDPIREYFSENGQSHIFRWWEHLDDAGRQRLLAQAAEIDLAALERVHAFHSQRADAEGPRLEPVEAERLPEHGGDPAKAVAARERGEDMLAAGRVAALVVAGGQGTRLGFDGPKGAFPIGPVTDRTLFEIQAQKIRGVRRRYGRALPWCLMTSAATDAATREFFRSKAFFGLPEEDVLFFCQGMVPSLDFDGRLLLETQDRIFENPDGHGGCLTALLDSGVLDELEGRGIDTLFYYQVDNPLVRMCDPVYLGLHELAGAEMSCKVVQKTDPQEKVGIVARANGRVTVVEYTELGEADSTTRDDDGELVYWAGNIAIHLLAVPFVRRVACAAERFLPYHASAKKIPHIDDEGRRVKPAQLNGREFQRFVFDALSVAKGVCVVETDRGVEFSPVKNAQGSNSPATARRDLVARYRVWLAASGVVLPESDAAIEVDHTQIDGPDDARRLRIHDIAEAGDAIRIAAGGPA